MIYIYIIHNDIYIYIHQLHSKWHLGPPEHLANQLDHLS